VVEESIGGIRAIWLRTKRYARTASIHRVLSWFDFEYRLWRLDDERLPRPDIIIVSSLSLFTVLNGIRLSRKYRVPLVFEVRDIWPLTMIEEGGFSSRHPLALLMGWIERLGYRKAALTIGTMPNLGPHASRVAGRAVQCNCIPFGFDPEQIAAAEASPPVVPRLERTADQLVVGYAGSMGISNALDTIVECAIRLKDDPRFKFVLLGDGDVRAKLMAMTAECPNVQWVGRVPRGEVVEYLKQCDLLYFAVHDSKVWESGMSLNKLTDYLVAAKPVLASYSGFPSILDEAGCGEYLPSRDTDALMLALARYAERPRAELAAMGTAGRAWLFANRTWKTLSKLYGAMLDTEVERYRSA
jgi:glycosyltransferase involved in cell wall biosynthesis